jgi:GR25 family glycosyltransferase involved in LPS biosynthesis
MEHPFDFFDEIYCINLDERTDRWVKVQKEFQKVGILDRVERFSAVKKDDGRVGIIKSNLGVVKKAKKNKAKNVLVFEDDVVFLNESLENLKKATTQLIEKEYDWELFYLGANTHQKLHQVEPNLIRLKNAFAVHAMCYHEKIYDKFIKYASAVGNNIINHVQILDVWLAAVIQSNNKSYMVNPLIATQGNDYSDIEKCEVNQGYIVERFKKNIKT